jgi:hypothetical protein
MKQKKKLLITFYAVILMILLMLLYLSLMPITFYSSQLRFWILVIPLLVSLPFVINMRDVYRAGRSNSAMEVLIDKKQLKKWKPFYYTVVGFIALFFVLSIISSPIFGTERYQQLITVDESENFETNINEMSKTKVPIVDKDLAFRLGDKKLGEYKGMGSQFTINNYTMIEKEGELYWVGALEYTGFFKWMNNKNEGVPGYVQISATNPSQVELVEYPMFYVPSAYFNQDTMRKMYFSGNMTKLFDDYLAFELDETGHPYYVKAVITKEFAFTRGNNTVGVVVLDAVTGEVNYYDLDDAPTWIDRIQPADLILDQLEYYGRFVKGYWNTLFAKREMMQVSEGYSYLYNDGQFYLYTGLTSVGTDESIVGFTLTDMRTKETKFYRIGGATEYSGQKSAEGAVQDLGYQANWPILVNIQNVPTYFMTLKDNEGLIKKYAYVNVKDYSVVGIGNTLTEAQNNYLKTLRATSTNPNTGGEKKEITAHVLMKEEVLIEGTSYYYLILNGYEDQLFIAAYNISYELPLTRIGDSVSITYFDSDELVFTIELFDNEELNIE